MFVAALLLVAVAQAGETPPPPRPAPTEPQRAPSPVDLAAGEEPAAEATAAEDGTPRTFLPYEGGDIPAGFKLVEIDNPNESTLGRTLFFAGYGPMLLVSGAALIVALLALPFFIVDLASGRGLGCSGAFLCIGAGDVFLAGLAVGVGAAIPIVNAGVLSVVVPFIGLPLLALQVVGLILWLPSRKLEVLVPEVSTPVGKVKFLPNGSGATALLQF